MLSRGNMVLQKSKKLVSVAGALPKIGDAFSKAQPLLFTSIRSQIICIDDLERRGAISVKDVFGLISYLREQRHCKIVLLLNQTKLEENSESKQEFTDYFEKVIDAKIVRHHRDARHRPSVRTAAGRCRRLSLATDATLNFSLCHVRQQVRERGSHSHAAMRISPASGTLTHQGNTTMIKNLALAASIIAMVAVSGQAFARATGSNTRYLPEAAISSDQQVVSAYDAFDNPAMATQTVEPDAHRYHCGPKYND